MNFQKISTKITSLNYLLAAAVVAAALTGCNSSNGGVQMTPMAPALTPPGGGGPGAGTGVNGLGQGPAPVLLGTSGNYVLLASAAIATVPGSVITGDVGISPAAASYITGFSMAAPPTTYTTSAQVNGQIFAVDFDPPTPSNMNTAILDMGTAYTDAGSRVPDYTELATGNIGGLTLAPATYNWSSSVLVNSDLVFSGGANDVWILQVAGDVTFAAGVRVSLIGGAQAKNIFWQVAGAADFGTTAYFEGILLSKTSINFQTGASAKARLLAQTAINLDQNAIVQP